MLIDPRAPGTRARACVVPRQARIGGRVRQLGISKRGDAYLRTLLMHRARSIVVRSTDYPNLLIRKINKLCKLRYWRALRSEGVHRRRRVLVTHRHAA